MDSFSLEIEIGLSPKISVLLGVFLAVEDRALSRAGAVALQAYRHMGYGFKHKDFLLRKSQLRLAPSISNSCLLKTEFLLFFIVIGRQKHLWLKPPFGFFYPYCLFAIAHSNRDGFPSTELIRAYHYHCGPIFSTISWEGGSRCQEARNSVEFKAKNPPKSPKTRSAAKLYNQTSHMSILC